jgi:hypothetical protein
MPVPAFEHVSRSTPLDRNAERLLERDILSFCARQPQLRELAFVLADNGHTHVGHVVQLTFFTVVDLAGGDRQLAEELRYRLRHAGLDTGLNLPGWTAPAGDTIEPMLE